ncbi:hypothetical protein E2320_008158 [Naja naja]|nr:hypothetical protein E2320_008158 [Naja naja]
MVLTGRIVRIFHFAAAASVAPRDLCKARAVTFIHAIQDLQEVLVSPFSLRSTISSRSFPRMDPKWGISTTTGLHQRKRKALEARGLPMAVVSPWAGNGLGLFRHSTVPALSLSWPRISLEPQRPPFCLVTPKSSHLALAFVEHNLGEWVRDR